MGGGSKDGRKINWVRWDKICRRLEEGVRNQKLESVQFGAFRKEGMESEKREKGVMVQGFG